jgi:phage terminase large subunit GpA-like protein
MSIPENIITAMLNGCSVKPKEQKHESDNKIKNISDFYQQKPGNITCNHCGYFFIPQNKDYFTCLKCNETYVICFRCRKAIENNNSKNEKKEGIENGKS